MFVNLGAKIQICLKVKFCQKKVFWTKSRLKGYCAQFFSDSITWLFKKMKMMGFKHAPVLAINIEIPMESEVNSIPTKRRIHKVPYPDHAPTKAATIRKTIKVTLRSRLEMT